MLARDLVDVRLLDEFQRGFPLDQRPFSEIGRDLGCPEAEVIARLSRLIDCSAVARVGATVRPNTAGASTLAAVSVPPADVDEVARIIGEEPGVNHSYLREDDLNLWFVATAPDRERLNGSLARIAERTGRQVLDLALVRPFHIDLGFRLSGRRGATKADTGPVVWSEAPGDRQLLHALSRGLALTTRPYAALGHALGRDEGDVIARTGTLVSAGVITRLGVIVRHRALGWTANAMTVWDLPVDRIDDAGRALAAVPGVTLCYRRRTVPGIWPYGLYAMVHARSRPEAMTVIDAASRLPGLAGADRRILFSTRCFKQTSAQIAEAA